MESTQSVTDFESTRQALTSLQRLLFCCQCSQLTKNVCTLGNCEHFFCKECVEERLGAMCPVCETPGHAKDAQVNRQLSNIVSLSLELGRLLQTQSDPHHTAEEIKSVDKSAASQPPNRLTHQRTLPVCDNSSCSGKEKLDREARQKPTRNAGKEAALSTPSKGQGHWVQADKDTPSRKTWEAKSTSPSCETSQRHACEEDSEFRQVQVGQAAVLKTASTPRTRVRSRQQKTPNSKRISLGNKNDLDQSSLQESLSEGTDFSGKKIHRASPHRMRERGNESIASNDADLEINASKTIFKTPTRSPSTRTRNKSPAVDESRSPRACPQGSRNSSPKSSTPKGSMSSSPKSSRSSTPKSNRKVGQKPIPPSSPQTTPRRRSAPLTPSSVSSRGQQTPAGRRKSLPPAHFSPDVRTDLLTPTSVSPAGGSAKKKAAGGNVGRVKRNAKGETPLHVAAIKGDIAAVRQLLEKGDNPNVRDNAGWTPLHEAVNHGNAMVTETLLQHGAVVNLPGLDNDTPLHDAVVNNRLDCVQLLVAFGAANTARNVHGKTALELAQTEEMREALLQAPTQVQHITSLPEPEDAEQFLPLCLLGTALSRDQRGLLQKCAAKLHAKVVDEYCPEVTHIVSSVNPNGQCPRTHKYLCGILGGKWIVSFEWLAICLEYGERVSEEAFEIPGSSTHPNSSAPHKARLNRRQQLPGLFDGCQVYLHGSFTRLPPSRQELSALLRVGGATLLSREPRLSNVDEYEVTVPYHAGSDSCLADCGIFIVHDGDSRAPTVNAHRMRSVPASWVVESIATFTLVEPTDP